MGGSAAGPPVRASAAAPAALLDALAARGETLAVAESLTGGLLAATLVEVPGASRVFRGGVIVYATDLKASLGRVPAELLAEHGPVHPSVAAALAERVRASCTATWGVATTGVAGPDPQNGLAPGTVYVAVSGPRVFPTTARHLDLSGDRATIRAATVAAALDLLAEVADLGR